MRRRIGGLVLDQAPQGGARGGQVAGGRLRQGQGHAGGAVVRVRGGQLSRQPQRGLGLAGRQLGADQAQLGSDAGILGIGLLFQIAKRRVLALLVGQPVQVHLFGRRQGLGGADLAQAGDHPLGARQVGHGQVDLAKRLQQIQVAGRPAQGGQDRVLGRAPAFLGDQPGGQAQRLGHRIVRGRRRLRQVVARQIGFARPVIGACHQAHRLGVLGRLVQDRAQAQNRVVDLVGLDVPGGLHLQPAGMAGILGQNLVHLLTGAGLVAGFRKHPRQLDLHVARGVGRLGHAVQDRADRGDRLVALAVAEIEARPQRAEQQGIGAFGNQAVQFGARGVYAALRLDKADQIGAGPGFAGGRGIGQFAQKGLGLVGLAFGQMKADQIGLGLAVVGEPGDGGAQMRLDGGLVAAFGQQRQPLQVPLRIVGLQFQHARGQPVGLGQVARIGRPVQQDAHQHRIVGAGSGHAGRFLGQGLARLFVLGQGGGAITAGQIQNLNLGVLGGDLDGAGGVALELLGFLAVEGHARQGDPGRQVVGILFGQAQILAIGLARVAPGPIGVGQGLAGLVMGALDVENVAELHDGAVHVAFFQQLQAGLVIFLGPLGRGLASGKRQAEADGKGGGQKETQAPPGGKGAGGNVGNHDRKRSRRFGRGGRRSGGPRRKIRGFSNRCRAEQPPLSVPGFSCQANRTDRDGIPRHSAPGPRIPIRCAPRSATSR